ncbi:hypothetical protein BOTBODRAFT_170761 [Botryobasidium botryosum FD-172 SS1]|uniref:Uncharacterized protein n=1 Tax=Botryobasidium botryosum (strain FD-172 SS1) TaxID=930990 RepID=A0A067MYD0_BOTB1|nr:hypothetical protein BOTBODRAFT_170761 [Botryobasidium botryosum FD-172 SS1]
MGKNLAKALTDCLKEYGLNGCILAVVTNNTSNNNTMCILSVFTKTKGKLTGKLDGNDSDNKDVDDDKDQDACLEVDAGKADFLDECLDEAIKTAYKEIALTDTELRQMAGFAKKIRYSGPLKECLEEECKCAKIDFHVPERNVATRWNSTVVMLDSVLDWSACGYQLKRDL